MIIKTEGQINSDSDAPIFADSALLNCFLLKGRFLLPEFTARVHGPSWRPENSGAFFDTRQLGPWTRVVETDL